MSAHTSDHAASSASKVLRDGRTSEDSKTAGGSALSQANKKVESHTSKDAAHSSAEVLDSKKTGEDSKIAAGSALRQREKR